jgi:hypothetical protein
VPPMDEQVLKVSHREGQTPINPIPELSSKQTL